MNRAKGSAQATSIQDNKKDYPLETLKAAEAIFNGAYDPNDLTFQEMTSLQMRCIFLLIPSVYCLIATGSYDEAAHRSIAATLRRWGVPNAPRSLSELKAIAEAKFIERATFSEMMWAYSHWTRGIERHSFLQKINLAARMIVVMVSPSRQDA